MLLEILSSYNEIGLKIKIENINNFLIKKGYNKSQVIKMTLILSRLYGYNIENIKQKNNIFLI